MSWTARESIIILTPIPPVVGSFRAQHFQKGGREEGRAGGRRKVGVRELEGRKVGGRKEGIKEGEVEGWREGGMDGGREAGKEGGMEGGGRYRS